MIKVLEFLEEKDVKPTGGPSGYVFNLTKNYQSDVIEVSFLKNTNTNNYINLFKIKMRKSLPVINLLKVVNDYRKIRILYKGVDCKQLDVNQYDFIHFHSTQDFFKARKLLLNYGGKTILTSHSPKPLFLEWVEDIYSDFEKKIIGKYTTKKLEYVDEYAFNNADYIIFPCQFAEEPYINNWPKYTCIKKSNKQKYIYVETGAIPKKPSIQRNEIRNKTRLNNHFILSYVGRHLPVKGYDKLKEYGKTLLEKYSDIAFLVCGKEEPLRGLNNKRWVEIGWTDIADSYINASDVFILPNKETYFDLIMLEVLSLGKIVVASYTGGNKYFEKYNNTGIFLYKTDVEFYSIIEKLHSMSAKEREILGLRNFKLYNENFNEKIFWNKYEMILKKLYTIQ